MSGTASKRWAAVAAAALLALATSVAVYFWLRPDPGALIETAALDEQCSLHQKVCTVRFDSGASVTLDAGAGPIEVTVPFELRASLAGLAADRVEVDLRGLGMDMGFNRPVLSRVDGGRYAGRAVLSTCTTARMHWEATVLVHTRGGVLAAPFRFITFQKQAGASSAGGQSQETGK